MPDWWNLQYFPHTRGAKFSDFFPHDWLTHFASFYDRLTNFTVSFCDRLTQFMIFLPVFDWKIFRFSLAINWWISRFFSCDFLMNFGIFFLWLTDKFCDIFPHEWTKNLIFLLWLREQILWLSSCSWLLNFMKVS